MVEGPSIVHEHQAIQTNDGVVEEDPWLESVQVLLRDEGRVLHGCRRRFLRLLPSLLPLAFVFQLLPRLAVVDEQRLIAELESSLPLLFLLVAGGINGQRREPEGKAGDTAPRGCAVIDPFQIHRMDQITTQLPALCYFLFSIRRVSTVLPCLLKLIVQAELLPTMSFT